MSDMIPTNHTTGELAAVVATSSPGIDPEAALLRVSPETLKQILEGFEKIAETLRQIANVIAEALKPLVEWATKAVRRFFESVAGGIVPRKWLHLAKHAKKARTRKKYRKRIREAVIAFLCTSRKEVTARSSSATKATRAASTTSPSQPTPRPAPSPRAPKAKSGQSKTCGASLKKGGPHNAQDRIHREEVQAREPCPD